MSDDSRPFYAPNAPQGRKFEYVLDDVPSGWTGNVDAKVTAVGFGDK